MSFTRTAVSIAVLLGSPTLAMAQQPYYGYQPTPSYQQQVPQPSPYNPMTWGNGGYQPFGYSTNAPSPVIVFQAPRGNCGWKPCEGGY